MAAVAQMWLLMATTLCCVHTEVIQQDSGNYTCEVRGPQSVVLGHVTHFILVRGIIGLFRSE